MNEHVHKWRGFHDKRGGLVCDGCDSYDGGEGRTALEAENAALRARLEAAERVVEAARAESEQVTDAGRQAVTRAILAYGLVRARWG